MKRIPLTQGKFAMVDDDLFDELSRNKWYATRDDNRWYAGRNIRGVDGKYITIAMHNVILGDKRVDHRDGDGLNNQRENLRFATKQENNCNRGPTRNNKSGFKGVSWHKQRKKWVAQIQVDRKKKHIGLFSTAEEAATAYDAMARKLHGSFARVNFNDAA